MAADSVYGVGDIEMALKRAAKGYVLGVNANHSFRSWGKPLAVVGTAKDIAEALVRLQCHQPAQHMQQVQQILGILWQPMVGLDAVKRRGRAAVTDHRSVAVTFAIAEPLAQPVAFGHHDVWIRGYVDAVVIGCGGAVIARHASMPCQARDGHKGLMGAAAKLLGATIQRCCVHFMRNALACVYKKDRPIVVAALRTAFDQDALADSKKHWAKLFEAFRPRHAKLAELMGAPKTSCWPTRGSARSRLKPSPGRFAAARIGANSRNLTGCKSTPATRLNATTKRASAALMSWVFSLTSKPSDVLSVP